MSLRKFVSPEVITPAVAILSATITVVGVFLQLKASNEQHTMRLDRIERHVEKIDEKIGGIGERVAKVEAWQDAQRLPLRR